VAWVAGSLTAETVGLTVWAVKFILRCTALLKCYGGNDAFERLH
jgi:hypothetical protein